MAQRPNILLIMTDQQRADSLGYVSGDSSGTPNLTALARRGTIFENAYSAATTCVPARTALLTGLLHHRVPYAEDNLALKEGYFTLAHALSNAGYETALFGKLHSWPIEARHGFEIMRRCEHLTPSAGYPPGTIDDYREWLASIGRHAPAAWHKPVPPESGPEGGAQRLGARPFPYEREYHPTSWITREALDFLRNRNRSKPYFATVSYIHPHSPYDPPEPYASLYDPAREALPRSTLETSDLLPKFLKSAVYEQPKSGPFFPRRVADFEPGAIRKVLAYIRALIKQIDDAVGELMTHVNLSETVVFFTSDHGDYGGHRGLLGKVPWIPFDDLAKVPFFCAGAGIRAGQTVNAPVQTFDMPLTALELAGIPAPAIFFDGASLVPQLSGRAEAPALRPVYCATTLGFPMIRCAHFKYIDHWSGEHVLFDLKEDPSESRNGATDHPEVVTSLRDLLKKKLKQGIPKLDASSWHGAPPTREADRR